jgi:hypothetical protein
MEAIYNILSSGVIIGSCIPTTTGSIAVSCSSELQVVEYNVTDCSGSGTNLVLSNQIDTCASSSSFLPSTYFITPPSGYKISCEESDDVFRSSFLFFIVLILFSVDNKTLELCVNSLNKDPSRIIRN